MSFLNDIIKFMEGRLSRFIEKIVGKSAETEKDELIKEVGPEGPDYQGLIWGKRLRTSEINDPQKVEELFQNEPVLGQTTLPFDGNLDMEIYRTRTVRDILGDKFGKPSENDVAKELQKLKEFVGT